jgi:thioredoxin reductase
VIRSVTVVGASLAGLSTVRSLRSRGYDGRIVVVGAERHAPYDRPPLSKGFLAGSTSEADLALLQSDDDAHDVEWRLGVPAIGLDPASHAVSLADGSVVRGDAVVLATGSRARELPGMRALSGVHVLRTLDDAIALRDDLAAGGRLVVVGGGFIGAEVASTARARGLVVTVVEAMPTPLAGPLGTVMGASAARCTPTTVSACAPASASRDWSVRTASRPSTCSTAPGCPRTSSWSASERCPTSSGSPTAGSTSPAASPPTPPAPRPRPVSSRSATAPAPTTCTPGGPSASSTGRTRCSSRRPLRRRCWGRASPTPSCPTSGPSSTGCRSSSSAAAPRAIEVTVVHGSIEERSFVATYERDGRLVAVLGVGATGPFSRWRRTLRTAAAADVALAG